MAKDCSFDVVSEFDKQELVNAVDQVKRDLTSRFDLKNSNSSIDLEADKAITITTNDEMNEFLTTCEAPKHDAWSSNNCGDEQQQQIAKKILSEFLLFGRK